jgi:uncharacterized membrane protein
VSQEVAARRTGRLLLSPLRWPWPAMLVWACVAAYTIYFAGFALRLYDNLLMKALDLGNMDQAVWNTAHSRPFFFTNMELPLRIEAFGTTSRLSFHVEPILLPLALLYRIVAGPPVLLVVQALVVALGALPLSWLARDLLGSLGVAALVAEVAVPVAYLAHPMLQSATLDEFHPVTLAPTFLLYAAWWAYHRSYGWFVVAAALAVACKEELGLIVAAMGLALAVRRHEASARAVGAGTAVAAVCWSAAALLVIIPLAGHGTPSPYWARLIYDSPPPGIHKGPLAVLAYWRDHPDRLLQTITQPAKRDFAWRYLAPTGLLAVLGLDAVLLALPSLALVAVTREFHMFAGIGHYTAEIVPFAFLAAVLGIRRLARVLGAALSVPPGATVMGCCALLLVAALLAQVQWGYTPVRAGMGPPASSAHAAVARRMFRLIPQDATVSAEEGLGPHLGERPGIYLFPDLGPGSRAQYIALDIAADSFPINPIDVRGAVQRLLASGRWGIRFAEDGLLLLQRGAPAPRTGLPAAFLRFLDPRQDAAASPALARFGGSLDLIGYRIVYRPVRYLGYPALDVATRWRVVAPAPGRGGGGLRLANAVTSGGAMLGPWLDFAATDWYPPARWRPGQTFWVQMQEAVLPLGLTGRAGVDVLAFTGGPREAGQPQGAPLRVRRVRITLPRPQQPGLALLDGGTALRLAVVDAGSWRIGQTLASAGPPGS